MRPSCLLATVYIWQSRQVGYEVSVDAVFVRHTSSQNDAVAHVGVLSVGQDHCLYVTTDRNHLLGLDRTGYQVGRDGITSPRGDTRQFGVQAVFGRETPADPPDRYPTLCPGARQPYGIGF